MSIEIIAGYDDPMFDAHSEVFYENFCPDDWDFIVIGVRQYEVENIAEKLAVFDKDIKKINGRFWAVTYHS